MASLSEIVNYLDKLLQTDKFVAADKNLNGLQLESAQSEIKKVAVSVDPGLEVFEAAIKANVDLLILHHGLLYGENRTITGSFRDKIKLLLDNGISLYSSHLPLDHHLEVGNAAVLGRLLGLEKFSPAFSVRGVTVGAIAEFSKAQHREVVYNNLNSIIDHYPPRKLYHGPEQIKKVGIATGAASFAIPEITSLGLDLFITGEQTQSAYHEVKDNNYNVIYAGHYSTEVFGVIELGKKIKEIFGIEYTFIDIPTHI